MIILCEVEARTNTIRSRVLEIFGELKANTNDPQKILSLATELENLLEEHGEIMSQLESMEMLAAESCSGPH